MASIEGLKEYVRADRPWDAYLDWSDAAFAYQKMHNIEFSVEELLSAFKQYWTNDILDVVDGIDENDDMVQHAKQCKLDGYWLTIILCAYKQATANALAIKYYADGVLSKEDYEFIIT